MVRGSKPQGLSHDFHCIADRGNWRQTLLLERYVPFAYQAITSTGATSSRFSRSYIHNKNVAPILGGDGAVTSIFCNQFDKLAFEVWLAKFLWHFPESSMLEGDAAEIISASLETFLQADPKNELSPLREPEVIFRDWATQRGEQM